MNFLNYAQQVAQNPFFGYLVREQISYEADITDEEFRRLIESKLRFVAHRPWTSLTLTHTSQGDNLGDGMFKMIDYWVYCRVGEEKGYRARHAQPNWQTWGEESIQQVINHIKEWHADTFDAETTPLHWVAVVKATRVSDDKGLLTMQIEIYNFPANFK